MSEKDQEQNASRRDFLRGAAGITAAITTGAVPAAGAAVGPVGGSLANRPNILFLMTDEERYPPAYETPELRQWRETQLTGRQLLRSKAMELKRHYTGSTACVPSRTTLFTGHYPSMHGASQTDGAAKSASEDDMFWLDPNTVPTMGNYFRTAGYRTYYKGKWHVSEADILIPGTKSAFTSYDDDGNRDPEKEAVYLKADRLDAFGFAGYVGPTPHGMDGRNSGSSGTTGTFGRDVVFGDQMVDLIDDLENNPGAPWLAVCSFVNPHDIVLYGALSSRTGTLDFSIDPGTPQVPPAPTALENLRKKPTAQESYRKTYQEAFQPTFNSETFRRLYYQLHKDVDAQLLRVMQRLQSSPFYNNTIVVFTSDHGELLGSHGGLFQKWHNAYEETIHVPMFIHNPLMFPTPTSSNEITSHIDIIPTLLGLAGLNAETLRTTLEDSHSDARPLVGRNLAPMVRGRRVWPGKGQPIYFMTDDEVTSGSNQMNFTGFAYNAVKQPSHVETLVTDFRSGGALKTWKLSRYFDNPQFWTVPCESDNVYPELGQELPAGGCRLPQATRTQPVPDQWELYCLTNDPYEATNLAHPSNRTFESIEVQRILQQMLIEQRQQKRLVPQSGAAQGIENCTV